MIHVSSSACPCPFRVRVPPAVIRNLPRNWTVVEVVPTWMLKLTRIEAGAKCTLGPALIFDNGSLSKHGQCHRLAICHWGQQALHFLACWCSGCLHFSLAIHWLSDRIIISCQREDQLYMLTTIRNLRFVRFGLKFGAIKGMEMLSKFKLFGNEALNSDREVQNWSSMNILELVMHYTDVDHNTPPVTGK